MAAANTDKLRKHQNNFATTLNGGINNSVTTIALNSVTGLPTDTAITLCIDRVDANGALTPNAMEFVTGVISGSNLTNVLRGEGGSNAASHSNTAVVEDIWEEESWNDLVDWGITEHNQDGTHKTTLVAMLGGTQTFTGAKTFGSGLLIATAPKIVTSITDTNGNEVIRVTATGSAVNDITVANAATGNSPTISATGDDTNIDLTLAGKGTGEVKVNSHYGDWTDDSDGATITFNMATTNRHRVTLGGNRTLAVSNAKVGQVFLIRLLQDTSAPRTVTWFSTIKWANGVTPTLTATNSKADEFIFICTSANNFDGFIVGQNL